MAAMRGTPDGGSRQQKADALRAEMETKARQGAMPAPEPVDEQPEEEQGTGPVGQGDYVVKQGDCISSIAKDTGHFWETIWNDPANAELKKVREQPNVLLPEDRVTIPPITPKQEPGETEMRHRFVRRGEPYQFRLRLLDGKQRPRSGVEYKIEVDDGAAHYEGTTDPNGWTDPFPIRGNVQQARFSIPKTGEIHVLRFGELDPVEFITGQKGRLRNLGFFAGPIDDEPSDKLRTALKRFQAHYGLTETAEPDAATQEKLIEVHRS